MSGEIMEPVRVKNTKKQTDKKKFKVHQWYLEGDNICSTL